MAASQKANVLLEKATTARNNGKISEAVEFYHAYIHQITLEDPENLLYEVGEAYHMIGDTYKLTVKSKESGNFHLAKENYKKAHKFFYIDGDTYNDARGLRDEGILYMNCGDYDSAIQLLEESYVALDDGNKDHLAELGITEGKLGLAMTRKGLFDEGRARMRAGLAKTHNRWWFYEATIFLDLAKVYSSEDNLKWARDNALYALEMFNANSGEGENLRRFSEIYGLLTAIYSAEGHMMHDESEASEYRELYRQSLIGQDEEVQGLVKEMIWDTGLHRVG
jgi:tetratricopeptide (TPR) repeat protein